jgi:putative chitinase
MIAITPSLLVSAVNCTAERAATYAAHLHAACAHYRISDSVQRLTAFLAQLGHESGAFRYVREIADGSAYEGRRDLGNTEPGDGTRYRGRGLIQTTGRENYRAVRDRLLARLGAAVPDFEADPEQLERPEWAAWSAADYWDSRGLNAHADRDDFITITRRINGGTNGLADRQQRWERARQALAALPAAQPAPIVDRSVAAQPAPQPPQPLQPAAPAQESAMPIPAFVAAALPMLVESIPKLGRLFGSGSEVAERNVKAAELAVQIVQQATGAPNAQAAAEAIKADPAALQTAAQAIEARWFELAEAGGGGIDGARKADLARSADGLRGLLASHSFWIALALLPLVYIVVLSIIGVVGTATWSDDVRASIAGLIVGTIVGGLMGYYFGQTTSRNRSSA